jgi:hypothetical protein
VVKAGISAPLQTRRIVSQMSDIRAWDAAPEIAEAAMNGGHLLGELSLLMHDSAGLVDVDVAHLSCIAWVVGRDHSGAGWQAKVELEQSPIGSWIALGAMSASDWDGWKFVSEAEEFGWPSPVVDLATVSSRTSVVTSPNVSTSSALSVVSGVARNDVATIELKLGDHIRLKTISSISRGFVVNIPVSGLDTLPTVLAILADGQTVNVS